MIGILKNKKIIETICDETLSFRRSWLNHRKTTEKLRADLAYTMTEGAH